MLQHATTCYNEITMDELSTVSCFPVSPRCPQGVEPGFEALEDLPTFGGPILGGIRFRSCEELLENAMNIPSLYR